MRNGVLQTVMCLVGLQAPINCEVNWKNSKNLHHQLTQQLGKTISTTEDLTYFANNLQNEQNFVNNLDTILIPRVPGSEGIKKVRNHIVNEMRKSGWKVDLHNFRDNTPLGEYPFTNIIATLNPDAPRRMVIACHYDSKIEPKGFLAATDSAVPCAMMLNLAKTMKQELRNQKSNNPDLTLQFLFFDGEEAFVRWTSTDSIYGARALASKWEKESYRSGGVSGNHLDRIDIFVLLDLLGAGNMEFRKLETSTGDWYDNMVRIEQSLKRRGLVQGSTIFNKDFFPAGIEDDHIPFKRRDVPILHLIAYPFPKQWHKIGDNRSSLNFARIAKFNKILRVFVAEYLHMNA